MGHGPTCPPTTTAMKNDDDDSSGDWDFMPEPEPEPRAGRSSALTTTISRPGQPKLRFHDDAKDGILPPTAVSSLNARSFCWKGEDDEEGTWQQQKIGILVAEQWAGDARLLHWDDAKNVVQESPTFSLETGEVLPGYKVADYEYGAQLFMIEYMEQVSQDTLLLWAERREEGDKSRETEHRALLTVSGLASGNLHVSEEIFSKKHSPQGICYDPGRQMVWCLDRSKTYKTIIRGFKKETMAIGHSPSFKEVGSQKLRMTHGHHHRFQHRILFSPRTGHVITFSKVNAMFGSPSDFPDFPWSFTSFWDPEKGKQMCMITEEKKKIIPLCASPNDPGEETSSLLFVHRWGLDMSAAAFDMRTISLAFSLPKPGPRYDTAPCVFLPSKQECWLPIGDGSSFGVVDVRFPSRWQLQLSPMGGIFHDCLRAPFDEDGSVFSKSGGVVQCWNSSSQEAQWTHDTEMDSLAGFCVWSSVVGGMREDGIQDRLVFMELAIRSSSGSSLTVVSVGSLEIQAPRALTINNV